MSIQMDEFPEWFKIENCLSTFELQCCHLRAKITSELKHLIDNGYISISCSKKYDYGTSVVNKITQELKDKGFYVKIVGTDMFPKLLITPDPNVKMYELGLCRKCWEYQSIDSFCDSNICLYCSVINE